MQTVNIGARCTLLFEFGHVCHCVIAPISVSCPQCYTFSSILVICLYCCSLLFTNRQRTFFSPVLPLFPDLKACCLSFWIPIQWQVSRFRCILSMGRRISLFMWHQLNWTTPCAGCILIFLILLWKACYFGEQPNAFKAAHKRRSTNGFLNLGFCKIKKPNQNKKTLKHM